MFSKSKNWLSGSIWKPKNPHSLEHLKFLYNVLCKNQTVTEQNRLLLVETLRSISEILIWGDQNDSSVFDFFLEKNMLSFFLRYLQQKFGRFICVQLLQTLNILFDNISNETSLYYLLSNNHINSIIVHKFDFSDEEVMAYYISFLKTLSLKLNKHTIHFFYNEHTNDFALYTEAIKFFNHSESMVRIAVRTITLNVFKVDDKAMLSYIRDRTASPYFSNLVWFIGNHILDLDTCVRHDHDHRSRDRLSDLVAEHLDHLHYLNDIFLIDIHTLNQVLTDKLLNRLLVPLYVYSLTKRKKFAEEPDDRKHVSSVVSLFLLSQVFLIIRYGPLMQQLADVIFQGDLGVASSSGSSGRRDSNKKGFREFRPPRESLEQTLENSRPRRSYDPQDKARSGERAGVDIGPPVEELEEASAMYSADVLSSPSTEGAHSPGSEICAGDTEMSSPTQNSTDEEKLLGRSQLKLTTTGHTGDVQSAFTLDNRPYLETIFNALECSENDYSALFALCLLYAIGKSDGISQSLLDSVLMPTERSVHKDNYNLILVERLIRIIELASQSGNKVRQVTLEMSIKLLQQLVNKPERSYLQDRHLACIEDARERCTQQLRNFYKSEEIFLDMFEDEYREMKNRPLNVEYLMQDASILLPPTGTPLTGIDFSKRLPCGEVERARRAIRVFFMVRQLSLSLMHEPDTQLPLTKEENCIKMEDVLDLNNSDLIACTVVNRESRRQERRFLVIDPVQLILVEPDSKRLGWGVVKFVGFLQDVEVSGDKDDSRLLHVVVHKPQSVTSHAKPMPILSARFVFDDHIRCMAAKQRLIKGRQRARQQKMATIERLLDIASTMERGHFRSGPIPGRVHPVRSDSTKSSATSSASGVSANTDASSGQSKPVRRVTAEQKRILQARAAQKSRQLQGSRGSTPQKDGAPDVDGQDLGDVEHATSALDLNEATTSAVALNCDVNEVKTQSLGTHGMRSQSSEPNSCSTVAGDCIPLEDLSQRYSRNAVTRSMSVERHKPTTLVSQHRDKFRFHRSLSLSPTRQVSLGKQESSCQTTSLLSRELSTQPVSWSNADTSIKSSVAVSQMTRPISKNTSEENRSLHGGGLTSSRRRSQSGPTAAASLRAADAPMMSLISQHIGSSVPVSGPSVPIPQLLPPAETSQPLSYGIGARPKQYPSTSATTRGSELSALGGAKDGDPVISGEGLTAHRLSLHGLQHSTNSWSPGDAGWVGGPSVSAQSPETPSSVDSAVSSDASMISVSSMASESSMDVDSDTGTQPGGSTGPRQHRGEARKDKKGEGRASASQQLTQLAQMVQEHYPYKGSENKQHTG